MPQIYVISDDEETKNILFKHSPDLFGDMLIEIVERGFGLEGKDDVAFTGVQAAVWTKGESNVQIEIRYTAGMDEYDQGKPFDPSREEQKAVAKLIRQGFQKFLDDYSLPHLTASVWFKPYYNSEFVTWF